MRFKLILLALTALISSSSYATSDSISIEHESFNPQSLIVGEWAGEPIVGDVKNYGIEALNTVIAFFSEQELDAVVASVLNFETDQDIHAVHLHGRGSQLSISELHGYIIVFGNEETEQYRMETYTRTAHGFVMDNDFSGSARGALDCGSAAKFAILHGPASSALTSISLGKTEYSSDPQSEEKFASYLTNATALLARERGGIP